MSELSQLYSARLKSFGLDCYVHATRLRQSILSAIPDLKEIRNETSRCYELAFDCDISKALAEISTSDDSSEEVFLLSKAAKVLRRHIFKTECNFNGEFSQDCQTQSVPIILTTFMQMLLDGPGILKTQSPQRPSTAVKSLSQLITFNAVKQRSCAPERLPRHIRERETPLSIYIGIKLYVMTRKESIIDMLHEQGLCISYKRLRTLSTDLANSAIAHFKHVGVVVPRQVMHGVFTTFAFDNIDHNPGATTSRSSFHGTCISLLQFQDHEREIEMDDNRCLDPEAKGKKNIEPYPSITLLYNTFHYRKKMFMFLLSTLTLN